MVPARPFFSGRPGWTLAYGAGGGAGGESAGLQLLVVDLEGNEETLTLTPRDFASVNWSPDGESVVYQSTGEGDQDPDIYTYNVELGTTPRKLTFEGTNRRPVFSADGTHVAFASRREGTDGFDLFVKTLGDDASATSLITLAGDELSTQWPSDALIVFEQGPNPSDLWMLDLSDPDSPRAEVYLPLEADLDNIVVSRDGTLAAYCNAVYYRLPSSPDELRRLDWAVDCYNRCQSGNDDLGGDWQHGPVYRRWPGFEWECDPDRGICLVVLRPAGSDRGRNQRSGHGGGKR